MKQVLFGENTIPENPDAIEKRKKRREQREQKYDVPGEDSP